MRLTPLFIIIHDDYPPLLPRTMSGRRACGIAPGDVVQGGNRDGARRRSLPRPSPLLLIGFPQQEIVMVRRPGRKAVMVMMLPCDAPCVRVLLPNRPPALAFKN